MKTLWGALGAMLLGAAATHGQGQFFFSNRDPTAGVAARFVLAGEAGTGPLSSIGAPDYTVSLFGGPAGSARAEMIPLGPASIQFRGAPGTVTAGYVVPVVVTVPGVDVGQSATVVIRVTGPGFFYEYCRGFDVVLGGNTVPPPTLPLGSTFLLPPPGPCIPEPSTLVMGLLGSVLAILCSAGRSRNGWFNSKRGRFATSYKQTSCPHCSS